MLFTIPNTSLPIAGFGLKPLGPRPSQHLQADAATSLICLQLFAQSGLEMAAFADMEALSNDMGLFLQVRETMKRKVPALPSLFLPLNARTYLDTYATDNASALMNLCTFWLCKLAVFLHASHPCNCMNHTVLFLVTSLAFLSLCSYQPRSVQNMQLCAFSPAPCHDCMVMTG